MAHALLSSDVNIYIVDSSLKDLWLVLEEIQMIMMIDVVF